MTQEPVQPGSEDGARRIAPVLTAAEGRAILDALAAAGDTSGAAASAAAVISTALDDADTVLAVVSTDAPALVHYDTVGSFTLADLKDDDGQAIPYDIVLAARVGAGTVPLSFGATISPGGRLHVDSVQIDND